MKSKASEIEYYIIGKGSNLYQALRDSFYNAIQLDGHSIFEYSTVEFRNLKPGDINPNAVLILFSLSKQRAGNIEILRHVAELGVPCLIVGSASVLNIRCFAFKYSRLKLFQLNDALDIKSDAPFLYGLFGDFFGNRRVGLKYISSVKDILRALKDIKIIKTSSAALYASQHGSVQINANRFYNFLEAIWGIRFNALIWKFLSNYTYGYSRID